MSALHTPGPWTLKPVGTLSFRKPGEDEARDLCIIAENGLCPGIVWDYLQEGEANARLIAAAPDLWKALDDLEAALDPQIYPQQNTLDFDAPDDHQYDVTITAKQWRAISAALTKAKQG